jgi:DNA replication protein DnaC
VLHTDDPRDPRFNKAFRCECRKGVDDARRRKYLEQMDGLRGGEREITFEKLMVTDENYDAVDAIATAVEYRRGLVTLMGGPGTGKSTLLFCAVNALREAHIPSVYTTVTDLLDYLRSAFNPNQPPSDTFARRWELLIDVKVLALDELDEFSATAWAEERFQRLIDERWRSMGDKLTLLATNVSLDRLPDKVASRLRDGRASIIHMGGRDMRPVRRWQ